ncbi:unnamed protein product [Adineta steineri]|uniref:Carrier domain-containing protein n=2 Tax=Adineta steineri TaxID=433720 RepID=A0A814DYT7_9BILA|nr:unnamed protein product [Adineta steineri]
MFPVKRIIAETNAHKEPQLTTSGRTEAVASFVQQRIWLHEQLYFHSFDLSVYNILVPLIIKQGSLSIERIRSILLTLIEQHTVLRTAVRFNPQNNQIEQYIQAATDDIYSFKHSRGVCTSEQLDQLLTNESIGKHFDIETGRVVRCHVMQRSNDEHDHLLMEGDLLAITFHHISFDNSSLKPFIEALKKACWTNPHQQPVSSTPQYIDFTLYEQTMLADRRMNSKMNKARQFWSNLMDGYDWNRIRQLVPGNIDSNRIRSGRGFSTTFSINEHVVDAMMLCASSNNSTMFALSLACYYAFLFKLMNDDDLCVAGNIANRFVQETKNMIGMFVNLAPYRMKIEPNESFDHLLRKVQQLSSNIIEHGCLPYQHIINSYDQRGHQVLPSTLFHYESLMSSVTQNSKLEATIDEGFVLGIYFDRDRSHGNGIALFDLSLTIAHDHHSRSTECFLDCSADIFKNQADVDLLANRFQHMLTQLFSFSMTDEPMYNQSDMPISKLSLILPEEIEEMQRVIFRRLPNISNEGFYGSFAVTAPSSYAQTRIWLDKQIRFSPGKSQIAAYNMSFIYRPSPNQSLSVPQLYNALQLVLAKHQTLHTSLIFDTEKNLLMQRVIELNDNNNRLFKLIKTIYETDGQVTDIMHDERQNTQYFDLSQGRVFRCHLVYYKEIASNNLLSDRDVIIFNFHHIIFDYLSINIFLNDLNQAYTTGQLLLNNDDSVLRYVDCEYHYFFFFLFLTCFTLYSDAVIERQMSMTGAEMFWHGVLHNCELNQSLSVPYDRHRLSNEHRNGRMTSISFDFGQDLSYYFINYASLNNLSLEHLTLATYFIFLSKLTNGQKDLCISMNIDNRYRNELKSIIGLFENVIPLRCQLDPHWSFHYLLDYVGEITTNSMKYSYFPLQRILNQHPNVSRPGFLDISFQFLSSMTIIDNKLIMIGDSQLSSISSTTNNNDFSLLIQHDHNVNQLSCTINASLDLFNVETIDKISQQFHSLLKQLFTSADNRMERSMYEISLTLPNEQYLMQSMNNTQVSFRSPVTCVHHEFIYQAMKYPQKLAVELDEQSMTYAELLYYSQCLSLNLLYHYDVKSGDIVCQCVERSLAMVIGILSIAMVGSVYCPLSPQDPPQRLQALLNQTHSRLVMVHFSTNFIFEIDIVRLNIDTAITINDIYGDIDLNKLSKVSVTPEYIVFTIFTSGSTGIPKAVQLRHRNFTEFMHSFIHAGVLSKCDTIIQMARCSFDNHLLSLVGTLMTGGTSVMLRPNGNMDLEYLAEVLNQKQITVMHCVPSLLNSLFTFLKENKHRSAVKWLRSLCSGGETLNMKVVDLLKSMVTNKCQIRNHYGPAEITINCTSHLIDLNKELMNIPIGRPLPNYRCLIVDQFSQNVYGGHEGELLVGGVGVFAGYFESDDLTAKVLININEQMFYKTGDLVRIDDSGSIQYVGRKDHQVKLHGQRIELDEIERCLLQKSIAACIIIKWDDDHLVAYVQSSDIDENQLREHCQSHLPPHMIPSLFVILDKLPLNANGKIDRKLLPPPNFSSIHLTNHDKLLLPTNEIEIIIHHIWCDLLKQNQISTDTNIFTLGGHSLIIMQLFHRYKIQFHLETNALSISDLFQHPTIIDHAQLIYQTMNMTENINNYHWSSLHLNQAKASFAQERIYLDEQIRFSSANNNTNMYVIPIIYRISSINDHVSITRLHHAFQSIISKHNILRTALYLDTNGTIIQHCLDANAIIRDNKSLRFSTICLPDEEHEQNEIVKKILNQSDLFDLLNGHVINCHILRRDQSNDSFAQNNDDLLTKDDLILFTIHHACFDGASTSIFIRDLSLAYQSNDLPPIDDNSFQYMDYSIHEHIMDMTLSQEFWQSELKEYNLTRQLLLPVDRQRSSTDQQRSGLASSAQITFDDEICASFLNYASSHHLTLFQLGLSIFYVFLFKLTHGETDLCISSINANRYRSELVDMIGMFVSTLPYRAELDPHWSVQFNSL